MPSRHLDIIIGAKDRASKTFGSIGSRATRLAKRMATVTGALIGGAGTIGVAAAFREAISTGVEFQAKMSRVQAVTQATGDEMKAMTRLARELGSTTQFTASDAAEAMTNFAMAGLSVSEILKALRPTLDLAAAGQLDMATASNTTAQIMRQMGLEADQLTNVVDILAKASITANTDILQLGEGFKKAGIVGRQAGKDLAEIGAALQAISDVGLQGEEGGTALRNIILRLQAQPEQVGQVLKELRVEISDSSGQMKNFADIVEDLNSALAELTPTERNARLSLLAGTRAAAALGAMMDRGAESLRKMEAELRNVSGTAANIASIQMDNLKGDTLALKSAWEDLGIQIETSMDSSLRAITQFAAESIRTITGSFSKVKAAITLPVIQGIRDVLSWANRQLGGPLIEVMEDLASTLNLLWTKTTFSLSEMFGSAWRRIREESIKAIAQIRLKISELQGWFESKKATFLIPDAAERKKRLAEIENEQKEFRKSIFKDVSKGLTEIRKGARTAQLARLKDFIEETNKVARLFNREESGSSALETAISFLDQTIAELTREIKSEKSQSGQIGGKDGTKSETGTSNAGSGGGLVAQVVSKLPELIEGSFLTGLTAAAKESATFNRRDTSLDVQKKQLDVQKKQERNTERLAMSAQKNSEFLSQIAASLAGGNAPTVGIFS